MDQTMTPFDHPYLTRGFFNKYPIELIMQFYTFYEAYTQYPVKISVENSKICGFESISKMMVVFFPFSLAHPVGTVI